MKRLKKGLYGHEFRHTSNLFGLGCGQMSAEGGRVIKNGGWYNRSGEKLGWGDLSVEDLRRISCELEDGELFIILSECDSFWDFFERNPGIIGSKGETTPTVEAPGVDYVVQKCRFVVSRGKIYYVEQGGLKQGKATVEYLKGFVCEVLTPEAVDSLIKQPSPSP